MVCKIGMIESYSLFSSGIKTILESANENVFVGLGGDARELKNSLNGTIPDIILIDVLHSRNAGIEEIKNVRKTFPQIPFLLIAAQDCSECFQDYLNSGAKGIVFATDKMEDLINAVQLICNGKEYFSGAITKNRSNGLESAPKLTRPKFKDNLLTDRELEVLKLFCDGLTYREIGKKLYISHRTVESHKNNILAKLNLKSKAELIKYATRNNLSTI